MDALREPSSYRQKEHSQVLEGGGVAVPNGAADVRNQNKQRDHTTRIFGFR